nr:hypothetical protein Iba_scaffold9905CG0050 [Ipomoea batatas]
MLLATRLHLTPSMFSTVLSTGFCAAWKAYILLYAISNASRTSASSSGSGSSLTFSTILSSSTLSYRMV